MIFEELLYRRLNVTFAPEPDDDGITDDWDFLNELDPTDPADALEDRDQDGATNFQGHVLRTNLDHGDSDGDGMPAGWKIRHGLDSLTDDSLFDADNDGRINLDEFKSNTSPLKPGPNSNENDAGK